MFSQKYEHKTAVVCQYFGNKFANITNAPVKKNKGRLSFCAKNEEKRFCAMLYENNGKVYFVEKPTRKIGRYEQNVENLLLSMLHSPKPLKNRPFST